MSLNNDYRNHRTKSHLTSAQTQPTQLDASNDASIEYHGNTLDRHAAGDSESDIRIAFRDFALHTGLIADEGEIKTEVPPATDSTKRVDMYARNTYVEFKRNLIVNGRIDPSYTAQLDGYLLESVKSGWGIENGILTDGKHYLKRNIGESILPIGKNQPHTFDRSTQGPMLREYLYDIITSDAQNVSPSPETLTKHLAAGSDLLNKATALLKIAHDVNRNNPTVAVKRKLWQDLLEVALGQDSTGDPDTADWLFIRHTYLTTLVALILQSYFGIDIVHEAEHNPQALLNGETLHAHTNLKGVIESDLFQWPFEIDELEYVRSIARKVAQFDWSKRPDELAAILYQNTISPEERRQMGEYYTPKWLAQTIVDELITHPLDTVAMDPACGSGTFIESLVRNIVDDSHFQGLHPTDTLQKLQNNVIGIDLHPVAVQLAKATWVLNSHEVINAARLGGHQNDISPPIYLGDSLQLRYERNVLTRPGHLTLRTNEKLPGETDSVAFDIPMSLARESDRFDPLLLDLARAVVDGTDPETVFDQHQITETEERNTMRETAHKMQMLQSIDRNHIWAYYMRNMVRPAVISEKGVDAIIGNPPWLTYSKSTDIVRDELVNLSKETYGIWAGGRQASNQDIATLFYTRVTDLYLKQNANIGMVLPHSVLRSGQHLKWRSGTWYTGDPNSQRAIAVDFQIKIPWDLDNLEPNSFFPVPSAVVFGQVSETKNADRTAQPLAPGKVEIWRGPTDTPEVTRNEEILNHDDGEFHSIYAEFTRRGADIFDRRLYFVSLQPNDSVIPAPGTFVTQPRVSTRDKKKYDVSVLSGNVVHENNLLDVYLGESIAPYVALEPLKAVLPVDKSSMTLPLDHSRCTVNPKTKNIRHNACQVDVYKLDSRMQSRWVKMSTLWDANKGKNDKKTLYQRLNYHNILTSQLTWLRNPGERPVRIAYTGITAPAATLITDNKAILDTALYQVTCKNINEAYYLLAIINSDTMFDSVAPLMPKGQFGARDLHKHLWKLPIPEFDPNNTDHADLSDLGGRAAVEAQKVIAALDDPKPSVTKARSVLRHEWQPNSTVAQGIEVGVERLLSS